jgi:hypothetical protein
MDLVVPAIASVQGPPLLTRNADGFEGKGSVTVLAI